jgi:hypothetical protein
MSEEMERSIRLLRKFLKETPKERIKEMIAELDKQDFSGQPTVREYLEAIGFDYESEGRGNIIWG